jgi:hypothetical protein
LTGKDVAEAIMDIVQKGEYIGGTIVTQTTFSGIQVEKFLDIDALFEPLKEAAYKPVRATLNKERVTSKTKAIENQ